MECPFCDKCFSALSFARTHVGKFHGADGLVRSAQCLDIFSKFVHFQSVPFGFKLPSFTLADAFCTPRAGRGDHVKAPCFGNTRRERFGIQCVAVGPAARHSVDSHNESLPRSALQHGFRDRLRSQTVRRTISLRGSTLEPLYKKVRRLPQFCRSLRLVRSAHTVRRAGPEHTIRCFVWWLVSCRQLTLAPPRPRRQNSVLSP